MPPPPPPRKPRREAPHPKLTKEAIEGKVPLRTFGELSALFAVKRDEPVKAVEALSDAKEQPVVETPPAVTADHATTAHGSAATEPAAPPPPVESTPSAQPVSPPEPHAQDGEPGV